MKHYCCKKCGGSEFVEHRDGTCLKVLLCRRRCLSTPVGWSSPVYRLYVRRERRERFAKTCERPGIYCQTCWKYLGLPGVIHYHVEENEGLLPIEECLRIIE